MLQTIAQLRYKDLTTDDIHQIADSFLFDLWTHPDGRIPDEISGGYEIYKPRAHKLSFPGTIGVDAALHRNGAFVDAPWLGEIRVTPAEGGGIRVRVQARDHGIALMRAVIDRLGEELDEPAKHIEQVSSDVSPKCAPLARETIPCEIEDAIKRLVDSNPDITLGEITVGAVAREIGCGRETLQRGHPGGLSRPLKRWAAQLYPHLSNHGLTSHKTSHK